VKLGTCSRRHKTTKANLKEASNNDDNAYKNRIKTTPKKKKNKNKKEPTLHSVAASSSSSSSSSNAQCKMLNGPKGPLPVPHSTLHPPLTPHSKGRRAWPAFCKFTIMIITSQSFFFLLLLQLLLVLSLCEGWPREV